MDEWKPYKWNNAFSISEEDLKNNNVNSEVFRHNDVLFKEQQAFRNSSKLWNEYKKAKQESK